jgi:isopentenyl-diphosphate delta-isomerase
MAEEVVLVNESDEPVGTSDKLDAHKEALLHRAFSVFIFNSKGEMLLQQRALNKYHSGGLWTNACCSHPRPEEEPLQGAQRRLMEELGFSIPLQKAFEFIYKTNFANGLTEFEYDHVFIGKYDGEIVPDKNEIIDYCFKSPADIREGMVTHPHKYTEWFKIAFPRLEEWLQTMTQPAF